MNSSLMIGSVRHRRFSPKTHNLNYSLFMACIDLDEISQLEQKVIGFGQSWFHWARFRREDYLSSEVGCDLKTAVHHKIHELTGESVQGKVMAVVHLRYLGIYFSPVNFFYVYDEQGQWRYLLAEVSNTPWNERHYYAIPAESGEKETNWSHDKAFHVSPFNPVSQRYQWKIKPLFERLFVHLECHHQAKIVENTVDYQSKVFDATLTMNATEFSSKKLLGRLILTPILTVKVVIGIYWEALKLYIKGVPLYSHPSKYRDKKDS
ncbi:DUF1365 family protein [Vibrio sp.]|nr:DUF1365 family protein [Vibrio sp.]